MIHTLDTQDIEQVCGGFEGEDTRSWKLVPIFYKPMPYPVDLLDF